MIQRQWTVKEDHNKVRYCRYAVGGPVWHTRSRAKFERASLSKFWTPETIPTVFCSTLQKIKKFVKDFINDTEVFVCGKIVWPWET